MQLPAMLLLRYDVTWTLHAVVRGTMYVDFNVVLKSFFRRPAQVLCPRFLALLAFSYAFFWLFFIKLERPFVCLALQYLLRRST